MRKSSASVYTTIARAVNYMLGGSLQISNKYANSFSLFYIELCVFPVKTLVDFSRCLLRSVRDTSKAEHRINITLGIRCFPDLNLGHHIQAKNGVRNSSSLKMRLQISSNGSNRNVQNCGLCVDSRLRVIGYSVWLVKGVIVLPGVTIGGNIFIAESSVAESSVVRKHARRSHRGPAVRCCY